MSINDLPGLPTEQLIEMARAYEEAANLYRTKHMKESCLDIAKTIRKEIALR
jgi:hypothetical protein